MENLGRVVRTITLVLVAMLAVILVPAGANAATGGVVVPPAPLPLTALRDVQNRLGSLATPVDTVAFEAVALSLYEKYPAQAGSLTSAVIQITLNRRFSEDVIGEVLARVAISVGEPTSSAIAVDVGQEGTTKIIAAFVRTMRRAGNFQLASLAEGAPGTVGSINFNGPSSYTAGPNILPPPCSNPSCT